MQSMVPRWLGTTVAGLLAVLLLFVSLNQIYSLKTRIASRTDKNTIAVSGQGRVKAVPDTAIISAGMYVTGGSATEVQNQATERLNKLTAFAIAQGVNKEDITTSQFNLYPQQEFNPATGRQSDKTTYAANQQITVKIRGVNEGSEKVSALAAGLTDNGANQINGINFTFDDPENLKAEARKLAIEQAKQKAQELAETSGVRLGKVLSVSEGGEVGYPMPLYAAEDSAMGRGGDMMKSAAPTIEPGNQDITVIMTLTYEIK